uniref:RING-type domain-containing protein n=1 Tax=Terrapene triunguis TaxID=2587831 RepID=A0A674KFF6_9SAUR
LEQRGLGPTSEGMLKRLQEDITCSICLDILEDPISIECGHNFCRGCLSAHWSGVSAWGSQCPECRAPCSRDRMTPDTRVKSLVEKIRDLPCKETLTATVTASSEVGAAMAGPEMQPPLGWGSWGTATWLHPTAQHPLAPHWGPGVRGKAG